MPIQTVTASPVKDPTIPFGVLLYALNISSAGACNVGLSRGRQCTDQTWERDQHSNPIPVPKGTAELDAIKTAVTTAVRTLVARKALGASDAAFVVSVGAQIVQSQLRAPARLLVAGVQVWKSDDVFTDADAPEVQQALPAVNTAIQTLNTRLQLV